MGCGVFTLEIKFLWGMAGNTPVDVMGQPRFGLSLIDRIGSKIV